MYIMYLMRTKKQYEQQDLKELQERRDRFAERSDEPNKSNDSGVTEKSPAKINKRNEFSLDELPDGSCFRPRSVSQDTQDEETAVRKAEVMFWFCVFKKVYSL